MPVSITRFGILVAVLALLPVLGLVGLGGYWLWQQGWLYEGMVALSANFALVYALLYWRSHAAQPLIIDAFSNPANPNWSDTAQSAWQALEPLTQRWQSQTDVLTDPRQALKLSNEVLAVVARHFHADSKYPVLEFPLPYLLKLIVLVCEDLQREVLDKIPGSHAVRVGDLLRLQQAAVNLNKFKAVFNIGNWLFNWSGAALAAARGVLVSKGVSTVTKELSQRLITAYINKLGYYAIQLYSGQISLDDMVTVGQLTPDSRADLAETAAQAQALEPLRFLVLGQVSSGKSSLINALFGEIKTAASLLPSTSEITPYALERDGLQQAIILDSAGYAGLAHPEAPAALLHEWAKVDVILLVCSATQAARAADAEQLAKIRHYFQEQRPHQALPVILAVVTQIDRLRPVRDWQPPYNIQQPDTPKAQYIRQACEAIAGDLQLPLASVVPVCLAPDKAVYNIEDGLIPLLHEHLDQAQRVRYLRCLRHQQSQSYWQQWRKQAIQAGRLVLDRL